MNPPKRSLIVIALTIFTLAASGALWLFYQIGLRAGRGAMCYEVAVHKPDIEGQTLSTLVLAKPGATSDFTFWGGYCTLTLGNTLPSGQWEGGRWRFIPAEDKLYADNPGALYIFPASGQWRPESGQP